MHAGQARVSWSERLWPLIRRYPASIGLTLLVVLVGQVTQRLSPADHAALLERIGADVSNFRLQSILTIPLATWVQTRPGARWDMLLLVALPLLSLEHLAGSRRAAVTFVLSDWLTVLPTLATLSLLARLGSDRATALLGSPGAGSSAAAHGTIAAACMLIPALWGRPLLAAAVIFVIVALSFQSLDAAVAHLFATVVGVILGLRWRRQIASGREARPFTSGSSS